MRIVSGGQTGVDRAALDAAVECGLQSGGWCPRSRIAEDGIIPSRYVLHETPSDRYRQRTGWNVRDSDATLILVRSLPLRGGTLLTRNIAEQLQRPVFTCLLQETSPETVLRWIQEMGVEVLNVAGPRESSEPGIGLEAAQFLQRLFQLSVRSQEPR
jgi:hypothetical protein